jgi:hypothetical protein
MRSCLPPSLTPQGQMNQGWVQKGTIIGDTG